MALLAGILSVSLLGACSLGGQSVSTEPSTQAPSVSQEKPEGTAQSENTYDFPTMGLTITIPDGLMERMEQGELVPLLNETGTEDGSALQYGIIS